MIRDRPLVSLLKRITVAASPKFYRAYMMPQHLSRQEHYWNRVAGSKEFTHPLDFTLLDRFVKKSDRILDIGCGYGRSAAELAEQNFKHVIGID